LTNHTAGERERTEVGQRPRNAGRRGGARVPAFQHSVATGEVAIEIIGKRGEVSGERYV
jgi:hypothetical protein